MKASLKAAKRLQKRIERYEAQIKGSKGDTSHLRRPGSNNK